MAKSIQEITFDAVEAFWRSAMNDLGIPLNETGYYCDTAAGYICASSPFADGHDHERQIYDIKMDEFEGLAAMLIRALAVEQARNRGRNAGQEDYLMETYPTVAVKLFRGREANQWVVQRCPFCRCSHWHGAGGLNDDPREFAGHRLAHCNDAGLRQAGKSRDDVTSYVLEWDGSEITRDEQRALSDCRPSK